MAYKQIPDYVLELVCSGVMTKNDVRVYSALLLHVRGNLGYEGRLVWPSRATLLHESGVNNYARLTESIAHLEALGCIVVTRGGGRREDGVGRANRYFLPKEPPSKPGQNVPTCNPGQNVPANPGQNVPAKPGQNVPTIQMNEPDERNQGGPRGRGVGPILPEPACVTTGPSCPRCGVAVAEGDGTCWACGAELS